MLYFLSVSEIGNIGWKLVALAKVFVSLFDRLTVSTESTCDAQ